MYVDSPDPIPSAVHMSPAKNLPPVYLRAPAAKPQDVFVDSPEPAGANVQIAPPKDLAPMYVRGPA